MSAAVLRFTIVLLAFGFGLVAGSPHVESRGLDGKKAANPSASVDFGCEFNQNVNPGKCWAMCPGSTYSKPNWCYTQPKKSKKPVTCTSAAGCMFDSPCISPCQATYYPEGPRGTKV